jgi:hypothetical protein
MSKLRRIHVSIWIFSINENERQRDVLNSIRKAGRFFGKRSWHFTQAKDSKKVQRRGKYFSDQPDCADSRHGLQTLLPIMSHYGQK